MKTGICLSALALTLGIVLTAGGVFGLYLSGHFWTVSAMTNWDEDAAAIGLPVIVILAGTFIHSYVLLTGPLLARFSSRTRLVVYTLYGVTLIATCGIVSRFAGRIAAAILHIS